MIVWKCSMQCNYKSALPYFNQFVTVPCMNGDKRSSHSHIRGMSMLDIHLLLLSCVNCHISRLVDASQIRVSSSRSVKPLSPFGGLCIVQSSVMCCTDWFGAPHSHSEVNFRPHLFMASPNLPTPVRIRL